MIYAELAQDLIIKYNKIWLKDIKTGDIIKLDKNITSTVDWVKSYTKFQTKYIRKIVLVDSDTVTVYCGNCNLFYYLRDLFNPIKI